MYLLDTNTVIDFLNAKLPIAGKNFLTSIEPCISVISQIELLASSKINPIEKINLEAFIEMATIYSHINEEIVAKTILIRLQHKTKLPDAIIAATALVHKLTIVTRNI